MQAVIIDWKAVKRFGGQLLKIQEGSCPIDLRRATYASILTSSAFLVSGKNEQSFANRISRNDSASNASCVVCPDLRMHRWMDARCYIVIARLIYLRVSESESSQEDMFYLHPSGSDDEEAYLEREKVRE